MEKSRCGYTVFFCIFAVQALIASLFFNTMHYHVLSLHPVSHFLNIEVTIPVTDEEELTVCLPSWRPGRYETGNFAKNIRAWMVRDDKGNMVAFRKTSKDKWILKVKGLSQVILQYEYYAAQADAGACWVDEDTMYFNPVHCLVFIPERIHEASTLEVTVPSGFQVATSLKMIKVHTYRAESYHELADSPVLCGSTMKMESYSSGDTKFYVWLNGECSPDWSRILHDFKKFSDEQVRTMGLLPVKEYHFLCLILPYKFYHGVEHLSSTVLALGPGTELMKEDLYTEFTGVASHELFHVWNVKTIRPAEMLPYDYTRENYSRLGYVYEGITTYYGDLFLARSGVYSVEQYLHEISTRIQKHFSGFGRFNLSVADASFDTWLDGYTPGIPDRKTSIYDEGCLVALMTDLMIRSKTANRKSLDDVMQILLRDFGSRGIGYTDTDYMSVVENVMGAEVTDFFLDHVYGTEEYEQLLQDLLSVAGCELIKRPTSRPERRYFGFRTSGGNGSPWKVSSVAPGSVAFRAGLGREDELIALNEIRIDDNLPELIQYFEKQKVVLTVLTPMKKLKDILLVRGEEEFYPEYSVSVAPDATSSQQEFFKAWLKQEYDTIREKVQ